MRRWDFSGPLRAYSAVRLARLQSQNVADAQLRVLRSLVHRAAGTAFGRRYAFTRIGGVADYQSAVPLRTHADFWADWWAPSFPDLVNATWPGHIPFFAQTSGTTTGRSKNIPYTYAMRRAAARGFVDLLCFHFARNPDSHVLGGLALALTGPTGLRSEGNLAEAGAVSAITSQSLPRLMRHRVLPPPEIANLPDWQEKIRRLANVARGQDIRLIGGSPNWMLLFFEEFSRQNGAGGLADWFPDLELIVHGGVNFAPYRSAFRGLLANGHAETSEMYSASEGVFAVADRGDGEGLRMILDGSVFFEFVPVRQLGQVTPERHWIGNVQAGIDYALVISTAAGLWSYILGDVVRLVETSPPRLLVVGRVGNDLSVFGEHLIEAELSAALSQAAAEQGLSVVDYCVGAVRTDQGGFHEYLVEVKPDPTVDPEGLIAKALDVRLAALNADYAELRLKDLALAPPRVRLVPKGGFVRWMKRRRKLGGQNKVPRIVTDSALFEDIKQAVLASEEGGDA